MTGRDNVIPFPIPRLTPSQWTAERTRAAERDDARTSAQFAQKSDEQWPLAQLRAFEDQVERLAIEAGMDLEDVPS